MTGTLLKGLPHNHNQIATHNPQRPTTNNHPSWDCKSAIATTTTHAPFPPLRSSVRFFQDSLLW